MSSASSPLCIVPDRQESPLVFPRSSVPLVLSETLIFFIILEFWTCFFSSSVRSVLGNCRCVSGAEFCKVCRSVSVNCSLNLSISDNASSDDCISHPFMFKAKGSMISDISSDKCVLIVEFPLTIGLDGTGAPDLKSQVLWSFTKIAISGSCKSGVIKFVPILSELVFFE